MSIIFQPLAPGWNRVNRSAQNRGEGAAALPASLVFTALEGGIGGTLDAAERLIKVQLTKIRKIVISRPAGLFWD